MSGDTTDNPRQLLDELEAIRVALGDESEAADIDPRRIPTLDDVVDTAWDDAPPPSAAPRQDHPAPEPEAPGHESPGGESQPFEAQQFEPLNPTAQTSMDVDTSPPPLDLGQIFEEPSAGSITMPRFSLRDVNIDEEAECSEDERGEADDATSPPPEPEPEPESPPDAEPQLHSVPDRESEAAPETDPVPELRTRLIDAVIADLLPSLEDNLRRHLLTLSDAQLREMLEHQELEHSDSGNDDEQQRRHTA